MFCRTCGNPMPDNVPSCPSCGMPATGAAPASGAPVQVAVGVAQPGAPLQASVGTLVGSILVTMFCCLPFGIVSIVYACKANSAAGIGNRALMESAQRTAVGWIIASVASGAVFFVLYIALVVMATALEGV